MKTKFFLIFAAIFLLGTSKLSANNTDSLSLTLQEAKSLVANWDSIPGEDNEKLLAMLHPGRKVATEPIVESPSSSSMLALFLPEERVITTQDVAIEFDTSTKNFIVHNGAKQEDITSIWGLWIVSLMGYIIFFLCSVNENKRFPIFVILEITFIIWTFFLTPLTGFLLGVVTGYRISNHKKLNKKMTEIKNIYR